MENLKIDEKHLQNLVMVYEEFIDKLNVDIEFLKNKHSDIFDRYMSYWRLKNLAKSINIISDLHKSALIAGHSLNHELLQTKEAKKHGWDEMKLENNPFFIQNDEENEERMEKIKKSFAEALIASLVSR